MTSSSPPSDAALEALWERVEARFDDEAVHQAFLSACEEKRNLAFAAVRYRSVKDAEPGERADQAARILDKIAGLAIAQLESTRTSAPNTKRTLTIVAAVVSFGLIGFCVYLIGL